jgi:pyrroline-5-carboxylate reductase
MHIVHDTEAYANGPVLCAFLFGEATNLIKTMGNFTYKSQYGVIAMCADEQEQKRIYDLLKKMGLTLKVVVV